MSSEWILVAAGIPMLIIGVPLIFLSIAFFTKSRAGWRSAVQWRSLRCPTKRTAVQVGFLEEQDLLRSARNLDVIFCSALADPHHVDCGKECLNER